MRVHHIGYLVKNIEKARKAFFGLGYEDCPEPLHGVVFDESRGIDISFIEKDGYCIELICPKSEDSKFYPLLKKYKNCAYHLCYETEDIEAEVAALQQTGWVVIDEAAPAPAIEGRCVCFMVNMAMGIIELVEA